MLAQWHHTPYHQDICRAIEFPQLLCDTLVYSTETRERTAMIGQPQGLNTATAKAKSDCGFITAHQRSQKNSVPRSLRLCIIRWLQKQPQLLRQQPQGCTSVAKDGSFPTLCFDACWSWSACMCDCSGQLQTPVLAAASPPVACLCASILSDGPPLCCCTIEPRIGFTCNQGTTRNN